MSGGMAGALMGQVSEGNNLVRQTASLSPRGFAKPRGLRRKKRCLFEEERRMFD